MRSLTRRGWSKDLVPSSNRAGVKRGPESLPDLTGQSSNPGRGNNDGQWLLDSRFRGNDKLTAIIWEVGLRQASHGSARGELESRSDPDFGLPVKQAGKLLESPLDPLALEVGKGLWQRPHQPVALISDGRVGQHAGHGGGDHMGGAEGCAQNARPLHHVLVDQLDQLLAELVLHQPLVAVIDGEREERAAGMVDADEIAMRDEVQALRAAIVGM